MTSQKATLIGLVAIVLWSTMVGLIRGVSEGLGPVGGAAMIYSLSGLLLIFTVGLPDIRRFPGRYLIAGSVLFVSYEICLALSLGYAATRHQAIEVGMVNYLWPSLTILFAILFNGQKTNWLIVPGLLIALTGVCWVLGGENGLNPGEKLWECRDEALALIQHDAPMLADFTRELLYAPLLDKQAEWCEVFDRGRATSLLLFEHVHAESRDRGQAMVDLLSQYETVGLQLNCRELPDHLPLYLEYLSVLPEAEAREGLQNIAPILALLGGRLKQRRAPWYQLFDALLTLAGSTLTSDSVTKKVIQESRDDTRQALDAVWEEEQVKFIEDNATTCDSSPLHHYQRRFSQDAAPQYVDVSAGGPK